MATSLLVINENSSSANSKIEIMTSVVVSSNIHKDCAVESDQRPFIGDSHISDRNDDPELTPRWPRRFCTILPKWLSLQPENFYIPKFSSPKLLSSNYPPARLFGVNHRTRAGVICGVYMCDTCTLIVHWIFTTNNCVYHQANIYFLQVVSMPSLWITKCRRPPPPTLETRMNIR